MQFLLVRWVLDIELAVCAATCVGSASMLPDFAERRLRFATALSNFSLSIAVLVKVKTVHCAHYGDNSIQHLLTCDGFAGIYARCEVYVSSSVCQSTASDMICDGAHYIECDVCVWVCDKPLCSSMVVLL